MSIVRRIAFVARAHWNHSVIGYLVEGFMIEFRRGGWALTLFVVLLPIVLKRNTDPFLTRYPIVAGISAATVAAIIAFCAWYLATGMRTIKLSGSHLRSLDE